MNLLKRAPREGVQQRQMYPEPWFITERSMLRILYRGLLGRPMDGIRWTNATFWRSASEGEDQWWLRLAGWQRSMLRIVGAWLTLILLPVCSGAWLIGAEQFVQELVAPLAVPVPVDQRVPGVAGVGGVGGVLLDAVGFLG